MTLAEYHIAQDIVRRRMTPRHALVMALLMIEAGDPIVTEHLAAAYPETFIEWNDRRRHTLGVLPSDRDPGDGR